MVQAENLQRHTKDWRRQAALVTFEVRMISELTREFLVCLKATPTMDDD